MQIKDFKDRSEPRTLAELLAAHELREFPLTRHCEIGPFVVEYLFAERALVVELAPTDARVKFLTGMGYEVMAVDPNELRRHPRRVLGRLCSALKD
jgi:very-short-patch-repair endonuclease